MQQRLFRESRKLERTSHIAGAILKNVHAFILLIDNDFKVLKTNYYQKTGTRKGTEEKRVGDLLQCRNALAAEGGCGTHAGSLLQLPYQLPAVESIHFASSDGTRAVSS